MLLPVQRFAEFAPQLLDHAEHLEYNAFDTAITHFITRADPDGSFDDQQFQEDERTASIAVVNGAVDIHASGGSPVAAAEMKAIFDAAIDAEFDKDCVTRRAEHGDTALAAPLPRTAQQRKFDALHNIFIASVIAPVGKTPEPLVNIVIDHITAGRVLAAHGLIESPDVFSTGGEAFARAEADLVNQQCSINDTPIHPDTALQAMLTGRVRRAIIDADGVTINLGRTQRLFTGKARQAAQLLAVTCTHRGCNIPAKFCDVDHRAEWTGDRGSTNQHNAMPMCGVHDRWKHDNKIRSRRAANGRIYLIQPDGNTIQPVGETEPDWTEPAPTAPPPTSAPVQPPDTTRPDPWAGFGRPMTDTELASRRITPDHGWNIRITDYETIRNR